jgi:hypothetical protein
MLSTRIRGPVRRAAVATLPLEQEDLLMVEAATTQHTPIVLTAVFFFSAVIYALGFATSNTALREIGLLGVLFFGIGAAPLQIFRGGNLWIRLNSATLFGFSVICGLGALMAFTGFWHPVIIGAEVLAIATALHVAGLMKVPLRQPSGWTWRGVARLAPSRMFAISPLFSLAGTLLWLIAALAAGHLDAATGGGLLVQISPAWFVGLGFLVAAAATASPEHEWQIACAVLSITIAVTLTPALVYGAPDSQSAGKHVSLILDLLRTHVIHRQAGIYQAYSGFFAAMAWFCTLTRVSDPMFGLAAFWPLIVGLVSVVNYRTLFGRVAGSSYAAWLATGAAILVNAIGQSYFSPQSVGFVMALAVFATMIGRRWSNLKLQRAAEYLLIPAGLAMAPEHELTPFIVGGGLLVLVVLLRSRPRWVPVAFLLPAFIWLELNHSVLSSNVSLAHAFNLANFLPPSLGYSAGLARTWNVRVSSDSLVVAMLFLTALGAIGFFRTIRRNWAWSYGLCAAVGVVLILVVPYGEEGIFRAALFAIPFLMMLFLRAQRQPPRRKLLRRGVARSVVLAACAALLTTTYVGGALAMDPSTIVQRADWLVVRHFEAVAPPGSIMLQMATGDEVTGASGVPEFDTNNLYAINWTTVDRQLWFDKGHPTPADLVALQARLHRGWRINPDQYYALWTPVLQNYSDEYGLESARQTHKWLELMLKSPSWRVADHQGNSYLFQFDPGGRSER